MLGLLMTVFAMLVDEVGTSIGKTKALIRKESIYTMGFLNNLWGTLFILALAFFVPKDLFAPGFPGGFVFTAASLPTFLPRLALEVLQMHVTLMAIVRADRSTFGFLRIITIPLLLAVDVALGYTVSTIQMFGIGLIALSLVFLFINHGIKRNGALLVLFTAFNAVATVSLYKYDITHFNSVEAEQSIVMIVLLAYCFILARMRECENPLAFLLQPIFFIQSLTKGIAGVILSFAYLFGPASIIITAKRASLILWAMLSGNIYFHEKRFAVKAISLLLILVGLSLLAF